MKDDDLDPRNDDDPEHEGARPPWRVTLELPVAEPAEVPAEPEPPRRVTLELPLTPPAPAAEQLLLVLRAPPEWGETVEGAFARKERELGAIFAALEPAEARELFHRLASPRARDPIAMAFARLNPERRGRLLAFLASSPRDEVSARARRRSPRPRREEA